VYNYASLLAQSAFAIIDGSGVFMKYEKPTLIAFTDFDISEGCCESGTGASLSCETGTSASPNCKPGSSAKYRCSQGSGK